MKTFDDGMPVIGYVYKSDNDWILNTQFQGMFPIFKTDEANYKPGEVLVAGLYPGSRKEDDVFLSPLIEKDSSPDDYSDKYEYFENPGVFRGNARDKVWIVSYGYINRLYDALGEIPEVDVFANTVLNWPRHRNARYMVANLAEISVHTLPLLMVMRERIENIYAEGVENFDKNRASFNIIYQLMTSIPVDDRERLLEEERFGIIRQARYLFISGEKWVNDYSVDRYNDGDELTPTAYADRIHAYINSLQKSSLKA